MYRKENNCIDSLSKHFEEEGGEGREEEGDR